MCFPWESFDFLRSFWFPITKSKIFSSWDKLTQITKSGCNKNHSVSFQPHFPVIFLVLLSHGSSNSSAVSPPSPSSLALGLEHIFHSAPQYSFYLDSRSSWWKESFEWGAPALEETRSREPQLPWVTTIDAWDTEDQASNFQHFPFKNCFLSLIRKRTPELFLWYIFTFLTIFNDIKK